jgi:DNA-binding transcriptional regulator YiaG
MKWTYQSEQLMICHQDAEALYQIGAITEAQMREFDKECLVPELVSEAPSARQVPVPAYTSPRQV